MATIYVPGDYSTIQAALNAASSGDIVWLNLNDAGPGVPAYSEAVSISSKSGITIRGNSRTTTTWTAPSNYALGMISCTAITIRDITIEGCPTLVAADAIRATNCVNLVFQDMWAWAKSSLVAGITLEGTSGSSGHIIKDCLFRRPSGATNPKAQGVFISGLASSVTIKNSTFRTLRYGILVQQAGGGARIPAIPRILNCIFFSCDSGAIDIDSADGDSGVVPLIKNCTVYNCGYSADGAVTVKGTLASGNVLMGNCLVTDTAGVSPVGLSNSGTTVLTSNYNNIYNNGTNYSGLSAGSNDISANPDYYDAANNDFRCNAGTPNENAGSGTAATEEFYTDGYVYLVYGKIDNGTTDIGYHYNTASTTLLASTYVPWQETYLLSYQTTGITTDGIWTTSSWGTEQGKHVIPVLEHSSFEPGYEQVVDQRLTDFSIVDISTRRYIREKPIATLTFQATPMSLSAIFYLLFQGGSAEDVGSPFRKVFTPYTSSGLIAWAAIGRFIQNELDNNIHHAIYGCAVGQVTLEAKTNEPLVVKADFYGRKFENSADANDLNTSLSEENLILWQDATLAVDGNGYLTSGFSLTIRNNVSSRWYSSPMCYRHDLGMLEVTGKIPFPLRGSDSTWASLLYDKVVSLGEHLITISWGSGSGAVLNDVYFSIDAIFTSSSREEEDGELIESVDFVGNKNDTDGTQGITAIISDGVDRGI